MASGSASLRMLLLAAVLVAPAVSLAQAPWAPAPALLSFTLMIDDPRLGISVGPNLFRLAGESAPFQLAPRASEHANRVDVVAFEVDEERRVATP